MKQQNDAFDLWQQKPSMHKQRISECFEFDARRQQRQDYKTSCKEIAQAIVQWTLRCIPDQGDEAEWLYHLRRLVQEANGEPIRKELLQVLLGATARHADDFAALLFSREVDM